MEYLNLNEWGKQVLEYNHEDYNYLTECLPFKNTLSYESVGYSALIRTNQYVGILNLPGTNYTLKIEPKTASKYLEFLQYAQSIKASDKKKFFYYDLNQKLNLDEGRVFLEIIAHLFLTELKYIFKRGLYHEYIRKEENINFLRGKLLISQQIKNNFAKPKFYCSYFDLTVDNFQNQAILYAALKVTKLINYQNDSDLKKLKANILKYVSLLKEHVTVLDRIASAELQDLNASRKNNYYSEILDLTKVIINESFFDSKIKQNVRCCNFLVDMNVVFERVVYGLLSDILENRGYSVKDQLNYRIGGLIDLRDLNKIVPDITVLKNDVAYGVFDAKYKFSVTPSDYYQIIIYSLLLQMKEHSLKNAFFINFEDDNADDENLFYKGKIKTTKLNEESDVNIYQISIFLGSVDNQRNYINQIRNQLEAALDELEVF